MTEHIDHGSCLCGAIEYRIPGGVGRMSHCHCSMCRKVTGAAFGTFADVRWEAFELVKGADHVASVASSSGIRRTFCDGCGATLQFIREGRDHFGLALGTLDSEPQGSPDCEIWTSERVPWGVRRPGLPAHETEP